MILACIRRLSTRLSGPAKPRACTFVANRHRPCLEVLEDRTVPTRVTWTGAAGDAAGAWSNGGNWDTGKPPQTGDVVVFTGVNSNSTSTVDVPFESDTLRIGIVWKGTINVNANLIIDTLLDMTSGTFGGPGKVKLGKSSATHAWEAGTIVVGTGGWEVDGQLRIGGTAFSPTVLDINGGGTLVNQGTIYQDSSLQLARLTNITNAAGSTYQIDADTDNPLIPAGQSINIWQGTNGTGFAGTFSDAGVLNLHSNSKFEFRAFLDIDTG